LTKIKSNIKSLVDLCNLISLKGKDINGRDFSPIPEFVIMADKNLLEITAMDKGAHLLIQIKYKTEVLEPGTIVIGNVYQLRSYLNRFGNSDIVTLESTENQIIIKRESPRKTAKFPMASEGSVESAGAGDFLKGFVKEGKVYKSTKTTFDVSFTVDALAVKNVIDDGEAVAQRIYPWTIQASGLTVKVGQEETGIIETDIPIENVSNLDDKVIETGYAFGIDNLFGNLKGRVTIFLASGVGVCPMVVEQETVELYIKALLAPVNLE